MTARRVGVRWVLAATGMWLALSLALSGCGRHGPASAPSATSPSSATTPSAAPPAHTPSTTAEPTTTPPVTAPPTTRWQPTAPQASADAAAAALVDAWARGDRTAAATVAAPAAVSALFAAPYPGPGLAMPRGCSTAFPPLVCTYGPPGGASPSDAIYEITVSTGAGGWYVTSVRVLG